MSLRGGRWCRRRDGRQAAGGAGAVPGRRPRWRSRWRAFEPGIMRTDLKELLGWWPWCWGSRTLRRDRSRPVFAASVGKIRAGGRSLIPPPRARNLRGRHAGPPAAAGGVAASHSSRIERRPSGARQRLSASGPPPGPGAARTAPNVQPRVPERGRGDGPRSDLPRVGNPGCVATRLWGTGSIGGGGGWGCANRAERAAPGPGAGSGGRAAVGSPAGGGLDPGCVATRLWGTVSIGGGGGGGCVNRAERAAPGAGAGSGGRAAVGSPAGGGLDPGCVATRLSSKLRCRFAGDRAAQPSARNRPNITIQTASRKCQYIASSFTGPWCSWS